MEKDSLPDASYATNLHPDHFNAKIKPMDDEDHTLKTPFAGGERPVKHSSEPHFAPGTILAGVYEVISFIGAGGMSNVYKCKDISIDRIVAVKALQTNYTPESLRRFQTEGKAIAKLEHQNIVKLYGLHASDNEEPVLVMEYIAGKTLSQILKENPNLPIDRVLNITGQICDALDASEKAGIVHRDLKPSNIMLTNPGASDECVKILDFGIAKIRDNANHDATKTGDIFGTPNYMSPEQALGKKCDARADQYALGCILFEMLSGRPPFTSENILSVILMHVQNPVPNLAEVTTKHLPTHLAQIVRKMMQKKPDDRFSSFDAVATALHTVGQITRDASRKFAVSAAVAVIFAGMLIFLFYQMHNHPVNVLKHSVANLSERARLRSAKERKKAAANPYIGIQAPSGADDIGRYKADLADTKLNLTYNEVIAKYETIEGFKARLLAAEKAWMDYRDAHLKSIYPNESGLPHSDCYENDLFLVTAFRERELAKLRDAAKNPAADAKEMSPKWDAKVQQIFGQAMKKYTGADPKYLQQSQDKWQVFRDADAELHTVFAKPGQAESVKLTSLIDLQKARWFFLNKWVEGVQESDKCAGTRPIQ